MIHRWANQDWINTIWTKTHPHVHTIAAAQPYMWNAEVRTCSTAVYGMQHLPEDWRMFRHKCIYDKLIDNVHELGLR